jgi:hypothetical protein
MVVLERIDMAQIHFIIKHLARRVSVTSFCTAKCLPNCKACRAPRVKRETHTPATPSAAASLWPCAWAKLPAGSSPSAARTQPPLCFRPWPSGGTHLLPACLPSIIAVARCVIRPVSPLRSAEMVIRLVWIRPDQCRVRPHPRPSSSPGSS